MDAVYLDLDGTLLGARGSLLADAQGAWSTAGIEALGACRAAGAEVVIVSGRRMRTVTENARILGIAAYAAEAGACLVVDGEEHWLTAPLAPDPERGTVWEQVEAGGAPALLRERMPGRLEPHTPWDRGREVSHLFRGLVDTAEADALLAREGHGGLRLLDNGVVEQPVVTLGHLPEVRAYHLVPRSASKAAAVAAHRTLRGHGREASLAVGDSREDLGMAAEVGAFWLVANAVARDPAIRDAARAHPNVRIAERTHGAGVLEAVTAELRAGR